MLEINRNPSPRELRQFAGLWFPAFWGVVGALVYRKADEPQIAVAIWLAALLLAVAGLVRPRLIRPVWLGMILAVYPIGWVVSHLLLAVIYYAVVTPLGLILRWWGRDALGRKFDRTAETYWTEHRQAPDLERYFRQF
jgi:hypothetical protein